MFASRECWRDTARGRGFSSWFISVLLLPHDYHVPARDIQQHSPRWLLIEFQQLPMAESPVNLKDAPVGMLPSLSLLIPWQGVSCFPTDHRSALAQDMHQTSMPFNELQPNLPQRGPDASLGEGSAFQIRPSLSTPPLVQRSVFFSPLYFILWSSIILYLKLALFTSLYGS